ncbi:cell division protein FtsH [Stieleria sp. JC731]|nr:cell division protein FtsH [Stieleria sp. JC731]MCC9603848.1 cell division protein FtsH [Stieleria sp. JC731]
MVDDEETITAYHEAGHAVIGFLLGGQIESVGLYAEADEWLPERFGDCHVNWGRVDANANEQIEREVLTVLAGPVAEMIYTQEEMHPADNPTWAHDWNLADQLCRRMLPDPYSRQTFLTAALMVLRDQIWRDQCWAAIAAVADELLAHESLDADQLSETLRFWTTR